MTVRNPTTSNPIRPLAATVALLACVALGAVSNASTPAAQGKPRAPQLIAKKVAAFTEPTSVVPVAEASQAYVTERDGRVFRLDLATGAKRLVADLRPVTTNKEIEQGLLSSAPAPDFATSRLLYAYFTRRSDGRQEVAQLKLDDAGTREIAAERRTTILIPDRRIGHNGGQLLFDPQGLLLIGVGDGGNTRIGNRPVEDPDRYAQNLGDLRGKILRIRPRTDGGYEVPADNPFADPGDRRADEIYAWGLRNPWRFSYDRQSERFFIGDVGAQTFEEVNVVGAKRLREANFGWSALEGRKTFYRGQAKFLSNGKSVKPKLVYRHTRGRCAVTGGVVVRGSRLPILRGRYAFADFCLGRVFSFRPDPKGRVRGFRAHGVSLPGLNSFGLSANGSVWVTTLIRGARSNGVYKLLQR